MLPLMTWLVGLEIIIQTWKPENLDTRDVYTADNGCDMYLYNMTVLDIFIAAAIIFLVAVFYSFLLLCYKFTNIFDTYKFHNILRST